MKILILSQWYHPEPVYIPTTLARRLAEMGHDVQVITGFPNYPTGELVEGYHLGCFLKEEDQGVRLIRVPLYPSHDNSAIKRIFNYASFAITAATIGISLADKPDVVFIYYPPSTLFLPALVMKLFWKVPLVFNVQDIWPEGIVATGMLKSGWFLKMIEIMERISRRIASHIIAISPGFKEKLIECGVSTEKASVIYNWCDENSIRYTENSGSIVEELGLSGKFIVTYAGNMGKAQALDSLLSVARLLKDKHPDLYFLFIGGGVDADRLSAAAKRMGLDNSIFLGHMPASEAAKYLSISDVLIVHLRDDPLFRITIPSKTQAYMAIGKPILMSVRGDAALLVESAGAGIACIPENEASILNAIEQFLSMSRDERERMGSRGQQYYQNNLALNIAAERIVEIFRGLVG